MRKDQEPASINAYLGQKRQVAKAKAARDILTEQDNALDAPIQQDIGGVDVAFRVVERVAFSALPTVLRIQVLPATRDQLVVARSGQPRDLSGRSDRRVVCSGSPRRDGAWPTSPILCVSIFFCFMMPRSDDRPVPDLCELICSLDAFR